MDDLRRPGRGTGPRVRAAAVAAAAALALVTAALVGCSGDLSAVDRAQAQVSTKEKAANEAKAAATTASDTFCRSSKTYIQALDRYGDVLTQTAPTVGDVKDAGADLAKPRDAAFDDAEAAVQAHKDWVTAQNELTDARAALEQAKAGPSGSPTVTATPHATATPLVPSATVDRVKQADSEFSSAQAAITDQTTLAAASEQFNSAAVALEFSWLRLFADAGCVPDEKAQEAEAAVSTYVATLQQGLTTAGYYQGAIDGVYGPQTVAAVQELQKASGLPVTGAMDKATTAALDAKLVGLGGAAAKESAATTAALQQTLKLAGFWDGPVDGQWTPALTEALKAFQTHLGVSPTGTVDAATLAAFEKAISQAKQPPVAPSPTPAPST
ncbi:peptidoglycan-binding domain-containing protein [Leifsonia sp. RAF41]|uniref:peptidoglycan-binding domain-containing protein n=1 Tax=Leifsonia sp. RAF41 TaxID=3233056 RepID=UPI003F9C9A9C